MARRIGESEEVTMKKRKLIYATLGIFSLAAIAVVIFFSLMKRRAESMKCVAQMSSIGIAAVLYANDHTNNFLPGEISSLAMEVVIPEMLICPSDHSRKAATNWASFTSNNTSYVIINSGLCENFSETVFIRCPIHGHLGYADGTVAVPGKSRRQTKPVF